MSFLLVTNPFEYDIRGSYEAMNIITTEALGHNLYQFNYTHNVDFPPHIKYLPLRLPLSYASLGEEDKEILTALIKKMTGFKPKGYIIQNEYYFPFDDKLKEIFVSPEHYNEILSQLDLTAFKEYNYLTSSPLFWLVLDKLDQTDFSILLRDSEFLEREGVIAIKTEILILYPVIKNKILRLIDNYKRQGWKAINVNSLVNCYPENLNKWDYKIIRLQKFNKDIIYYCPPEEKEEIYVNPYIALTQKNFSIILTGSWMEIKEPSIADKTFLRVTAYLAYYTLFPFRLREDIVLMFDLSLRVNLENKEETKQFLIEWKTQQERLNQRDYKILNPEEVKYLKNKGLTGLI